MRAITATAIDALRRDVPLYRALKELLDGINATRNALERGDYVAEPFYGKWGTLWSSALSLQPGSSAPAYATVRAGNLPGFAAGNSLWGTLELPETFASGNELAPTLVFTFDVAPAAGDTFTWQIVGTIAPAGGVFPAPGTFTATYTANGGEQYRAVRLAIPLPRITSPPGAVSAFQVVLFAKSSAQTPYLVGVSWAHRKRFFGLEERT